MGYHVPILGYHRVGPFKGDHVPTVSPDAFGRQLAFLARHRYRVLTLEEVVQRLEQRAPFPRRSVAMTFDDGYEETCTVAWPLLKRFGFPATVFVTPTEVGLPGFATWDQLIQLASDGFAIGSHTMHHSYLPLVPEDRLLEELLQSKRVIEERTGQAVRFLSYPVGGFTSQTQAIVKRAGYLAACTTNRALAGGAIDRYALRRVKVTERDANPVCFFAKVSGYYDLFRRLKEPS
ncbi:MAG: polysaccharide deacetylase family protein [Candidatus Omnitrophota bacterium]|nr:polysaccharide deacetylase family protein [Candidatus Omnitrophota bacterium]